MQWEDISADARQWMKDIGGFSPTVSARAVAGVMEDADGERCKASLESTDLRRLAAACLEVADWLDRQADTADVQKAWSVKCCTACGGRTAHFSGCPGEPSNPLI